MTALLLLAAPTHARTATLADAHIVLVTNMGRCALRSCDKHGHKLWHPDLDAALAYLVMRSTARAFTDCGS